MEAANGGSLNCSAKHPFYGKPGTGHYTNNVSNSAKCIDEITPTVLNCLASIPVKPGSVFSIADYGCSDGGTSMGLMHACVKELRRLSGKQLEICIKYEDQPINDFKSLFFFLHGLMPGPRSYLSEFRNVYVSACGTDFYNQCFPSDSINLGFSSIAVHWLSRKPCDISDATVHLLSENPAEKEIFRKQAESDWESFLQLRAKELSPGGRLALTVLSDWGDERRTAAEQAINYDVQLYLAIHEVLRNMVEDGFVSKEELHDITFCCYYRTPEELMKPFQLKDSPVRKAGLTILSLETRGVPVLDWTKNVDAKTAAKSLTDSMRCWSNYTLLSGLSDARTPEDKAMTVDEIYKRLEAKLLPKVWDQLELLTSFVIIEKSM